MPSSSSKGGGTGDSSGPGAGPAKAAPPAPGAAEPATPAPAPRPTRRAADQIIDILAAQGIRTVFGIPGGAIAPLHDALLDHPEIRAITCKHESNAVFAAAAYARATESVGVVLVTSGPGVTNAITGLASAYCDSLPVVLLAGEVPRAMHGRGALQEGSIYTIDLRAMVQRITKATFELTASQGTATVIGKAIATARSGRQGPVFVNLPVDVTREPVAPPKIGAQVSSQFTVAPLLLDEVADLLAGAERPMILVGSGARWGRGPEQLVRLAERGRIPVATTPKAKGVFPEDHPLSLGIYGHAGHEAARRYLEEEVDVLFAVATGFGELATHGWRSPMKAHKAFLQLDIDGAQIGKNYAVDIGLVGPAEVILRQLLERLPQSRRLHEVRRFEPATDPRKATGGKRLAPQRALWELQQALPEDAIWCVDIGNHHAFALHYLQLKRPDCFFFSSGLGSMASSIGAAIGVKLARPDRPVVCLCGDGTLTMAGTELLTAAQQELPILFAVMNNGRYGMVEDGNSRIFGRTPRYPTAPLDLAALAGALGCTSLTASHPGDIEKLDLAERDGRPILLDIRVDADEPAPGGDRFATLATVKEGL